MNAISRELLRRLAVALLALGALVMSAGVAMVTTAGPAAADKPASGGHIPVNICHATSSDTNPYVFITVDASSTKFAGHLMHRNDPNKTWKNAGDFNGTSHTAGQAKPDLIGSYTDAKGVFHQMDGDITAASCESSTPPQTPEAVADVDFTEPTCLNDNTPSWDGEGDNVEFAIQSGTVAPGQTVVIRATATGDAKFDDDSAFKDFEHTFKAAEADCEVVSPPKEASAAVTFTDPTCANGNVADFTSTLTNAEVAITKGSKTPGTEIEVTATATNGAEFSPDVTTKVFTHTYGAAEANCSTVAPPETSTPPETTEVAGPKTDEPAAAGVVTPTVVHAGLVSQQDLRGEQGMALIGTGAVLLLAGGLGLFRTGDRRRARV